MPSDGEADNAAGVATVLALAEDLGGSLRSFDVWVLLTGSQKPVRGRDARLAAPTPRASWTASAPR